MFYYVLPFAGGASSTGCFFKKSQLRCRRPPAELTEPAPHNLPPCMANCPLVEFRDVCLGRNGKGEVRGEGWSFPLCSKVFFLISMVVSRCFRFCFLDFWWLSRD